MSEKEKSPSEYLTFGKHRGKRIKDVPTSYLRWVNDNLNDWRHVNHECINACKAEYRRRVEEKREAHRREMKKIHPGGNNSPIGW